MFNPEGIPKPNGSDDHDFSFDFTLKPTERKKRSFRMSIM